MAAKEDLKHLVESLEFFQIGKRLYVELTLRGIPIENMNRKLYLTTKVANYQCDNQVKLQNFHKIGDSTQKAPKFSQSFLDLPKGQQKITDAKFQEVKPLKTEPIKIEVGAKKPMKKKQRKEKSKKKDESPKTNDQQLAAIEISDNSIPSHLESPLLESTKNKDSSSDASLLFTPDEKSKSGSSQLPAIAENESMVEIEFSTDAERSNVTDKSKVSF